MPWVIRRATRQTEPAIRTGTLPGIALALRDGYPAHQRDGCRYQSVTRLSGGRYILSPGLTSKAA
jgi:hypothetical protein